jgi:hypothetical protein
LEICRVAVPHSFHPDPDPAFEAEYHYGSESGSNKAPDPDSFPIQGFNDQKLKKKIELKKNLIFFGSKTTIYLSLGFP